MTPKEHERAAEAEVKATIQWLSDESDKLCEKLGEKLGSEYRIDDPRNRPAFKKLRKDFARRMTAIGEKYGLFPNTK